MCEHVCAIRFDSKFITHWTCIPKKMNLALKLLRYRHNATIQDKIIIIFSTHFDEGRGVLFYYFLTLLLKLNNLYFEIIKMETTLPSIFSIFLNKIN